MDSQRRYIAKGKYSTTPHDPSVGFLEGLDVLLWRHNLALAEVEHIVHGTTLVANAIIERKGACVGLLATAGFRDALEIRREVRFDMYDLGLEFPDPLVPRRLRRGVRERVDADGNVIDQVDLEQVRVEVEKLVYEGVAALAVCFLHSYVNPSHEERVRAFLGREFPQLYVSISSEIVPSIGEYERTSTFFGGAGGL